jgi:hypothetical protein
MLRILWKRGIEMQNVKATQLLDARSDDDEMTNSINPIQSKRHLTGVYTGIEFSIDNSLFRIAKKITPSLEELTCYQDFFVKRVTLSSTQPVTVRFSSDEIFDVSTRDVLEDETCLLRYYFCKTIDFSSRTSGLKHSIPISTRGTNLSECWEGLLNKELVGKYFDELRTHFEEIDQTIKVKMEPSEVDELEFKLEDFEEDLDVDIPPYSTKTIKVILKPLEYDDESDLWD